MIVLLWVLDKGYRYRDTKDQESIVNPKQCSTFENMFEFDVSAYIGEKRMRAGQAEAFGKSK